jgi:hypothetical protein
MSAATTSDPLAWPISEILAAWRLTHLLWAEDGPWNAAAQLRGWANKRGIRVFDCLYCLSLWVALPIAWLVARSFAGLLLGWFAISGGAILLERLMSGTAPPAMWRDDVPPASQDER